MSGNTFGKIFRVTSWGESHGSSIGVVVDGVPAGMPLGEADVQKKLGRRPGQSIVTTPRAEKDRVEILSGVFQGKTRNSYPIRQELLGVPHQLYHFNFSRENIKP